MNHVERFHNVMKFKPVDRIPTIEIATWWDKTIERWKNEGLPGNIKYPDNVNTHREIAENFGLDSYQQYWISPKKPDFLEINWEEMPDLKSYQMAKKYLYPEEPLDREAVKEWAVKQAKGEMVIWITLEGFFWFPRTLFGIEKHLYAFYDSTETMHMMNRDLLEFNLRAYEEFCKICIPDFMTFAEDMSYNHGPMVSKKLFDEFMLPYYKKIAPVLQDRGTVIFIDSDGQVDQLISWFAQAGIDGFLPLEHQAGVDIEILRRQYPKLRLVGAYDKMVMNKTEKEMKEEFERILPIMKSGGYIPSVDHQTPPGVSLKNYRIYLKLLKEYCNKI